VAYQFADVGVKLKKEDFLNKFHETMERRNITNVKVINQSFWPYFYHFEQEQIDEYYPWQILEMQGTNRTLYAGSSTCFESVNDVMNYNLMLLDRYVDD